MKRVQMHTVKGTTVTKSEEISLEKYVTLTTVGMNALRMVDRTVLYPSLRESLECLVHSRSLNPVVMTTWENDWCDLHFWIEG